MVHVHTGKRASVQTVTKKCSKRYEFCITTAATVAAPASAPLLVPTPTPTVLYFSFQPSNLLVIKVVRFRKEFLSG